MHDITYAYVCICIYTYSITIRQWLINQASIKTYIHRSTCTHIHTIAHTHTHKMHPCTVCICTFGLSVVNYMNNKRISITGIQSTCLYNMNSYTPWRVLYPYVVYIHGYRIYNIKYSHTIQYITMHCMYSCNAS